MVCCDIKSVQLSPQSCPTLCDPMDCSTRQASLSITNSWSSLKLMSIELVMPSSHLILCHPFLPPSIFPSIRVFSNESALRIRWPKDWSFSFNISPSSEYSGLISFRMDWLDLLADQGTLKSLLQHHSSKASILRYSAFFRVQLSHPCMTPGTLSSHSSPCPVRLWVGQPPPQPLCRVPDPAASSGPTGARAMLSGGWGVGSETTHPHELTRPPNSSFHPGDSGRVRPCLGPGVGMSCQVRECFRLWPTWPETPTQPPRMPGGGPHLGLAAAAL